MISAQARVRMYPYPRLGVYHHICLPRLGVYHHIRLPRLRVIWHQFQKLASKIDVTKTEVPERNSVTKNTDDAHPQTSDSSDSVGFSNFGFFWWEFPVGSAIFGISDLDFLKHEYWMSFFYGNSGVFFWMEFRILEGLGGCGVA